MTHQSPPVDIHANVHAILEVISQAAHRAGRDPATVKLVAATKMVPVERMLEAYETNVRIFGENRLQEAQSKMEAFNQKPDLAWHFIGRLQRRKIKGVVGRFSLIHSVEGVNQAADINRQGGEAGIKQNVLLEVNIGGESSKGGFAVPELKAALPDLEAMSNLSIQGLMAIPPLEQDPESSRPYFRELAQLAKTIQESSSDRVRMQELSMGMSHDFPIAIEEGATLVRIGTAIFGPR